MLLDLVRQQGVLYGHHANNTLQCIQVTGKWIKSATNVNVSFRLSLRPLSSLVIQYGQGRFTHSMPCPCRAAKGLECAFPIWFTQGGRVWFTLAMLCPCQALTIPFFSRPRHSTAVERWPVGYLPALSFFRLPRGVPRRLLSEAYQSSSQRSIPTTVKSHRVPLT